jgi:hypothetical protein
MSTSEFREAPGRYSLVLKLNMKWEKKSKQTSDRLLFRIWLKGLEDLRNY